MPVKLTVEILVLYKGYYAKRDIKFPGEPFDLLL
jgi:hypothetical protein